MSQPNETVSRLNDQPGWKEVLDREIPEHLRREIDVYESQLELRRTGGIEEAVFTEIRLRRGIYGQRYDSGQRHDGIRPRRIQLPADRARKGPNTLWDAPGMVRIKIPGGALTIQQLEVIADLSEEYSDGISHATTRQDIQLHFVHIDDTPDLMRRLAAAGLTTREACGNSVRNIAACPLAGVCREEAFDITPYARACSGFLLGHPDAQDFGRKFKASFSGCREQACGLARMHDLGFIARVERRGTEVRRGFEVYVGGGLGAIPQQAKLFDRFLPVEEMLPLAQAIARVFAARGEKKNRSRARLKFLVASLGIEEFRRLVLEEREKLQEDPRWTAFLQDLHRHDEPPLRPGRPLETNGASLPPDFLSWHRTNVIPQRQAHYSVALASLPLGDATAIQMRALADLARRFSGDTIRVTVDQNMAFRWISDADLPAFHEELKAAGLGQPGAGTIIDVTACPGTDTCKLGISSSRGLAAELRQRLAARNLELDEAVKNLRIKISGCFNSCGQHHVADIGFFGVSRKVGNHLVPHFQVVLGGQWGENAGSYGLAIGAVPSKRIPEALLLITDRYVTWREPGESFQSFTRRMGKAQVKGWLQDLTLVPAHALDPSYYSDWGDPREFTIGDLGVGECAGQVVSTVDFDLAESERVAFDAQLQLDQGKTAEAARLAYRAMLKAAGSLVRARRSGAGESSDDQIVAEFRREFYDTKLFFDPYAGGKFASYLFRAHRNPVDGISGDEARQRVEEAQLFLEAAHACNTRMMSQEKTVCSIQKKLSASA